MSGLVNIGAGGQRRASAQPSMLSREEIAEIEALIEEYPDPRAASIEALRCVQRHRGWVSDGAIARSPAMTRCRADELEGVATFYNLIYPPAGRPARDHVLRQRVAASSSATTRSARAISKRSWASATGETTARRPLHAAADRAASATASAGRR